MKHPFGFDEQVEIGGEGNVVKKRLTWPQRMVELARHWAQYSTCTRRKVGAVVYDSATFAIISIGYNDTPKGWLDCNEGGCQVCADEDTPAKTNLDCNCVHAEMNAVLLAAGPTKGAHLAVWTDAEQGKMPCTSCMKHLVQAGISSFINEDRAVALAEIPRYATGGVVDQGWPHRPVVEAEKI